MRPPQPTKHRRGQFRLGAHTPPSMGGGLSRVGFDADVANARRKCATRLSQGADPAATPHGVDAPPNLLGRARGGLVRGPAHPSFGPKADLARRNRGTEAASRQRELPVLAAVGQTQIRLLASSCRTATSAKKASATITTAETIHQGQTALMTKNST